MQNRQRLVPVARTPSRKQDIQNAGAGGKTAKGSRLRFEIFPHKVRQFPMGTTNAICQRANPPFFSARGASMEEILSLLWWLVKLPFLILKGLLAVLVFPLQALLWLLMACLWIGLGAWLATKLRLSPLLGGILGFFGLPGILALAVVGLAVALQNKRS